MRDYKILSDIPLTKNRLSTQHKNQITMVVFGRCVYVYQFVKLNLQHRRTEMMELILLPNRPFKLFLEFRLNISN